MPIGRIIAAEKQHRIDDTIYRVLLFLALIIPLFWAYKLSNLSYDQPSNQMLLATLFWPIMLLTVAACWRCRYYADALLRKEAPFVKNPIDPFFVFTDDQKEKMDRWTGKFFIAIAGIWLVVALGATLYNAYDVATFIAGIGSAVLGLAPAAAWNCKRSLKILVDTQEGKKTPVLHTI